MPAPPVESRDSPFRILPFTAPAFRVSFFNPPRLKAMKLEPLHPIQIQRFREMTFAEKWAVAQGLWIMARDARLAATRRANPDLSEEECRKLVAREFASTRT